MTMHDNHGVGIEKKQLVCRVRVWAQTGRTEEDVFREETIVL